MHLDAAFGAPVHLRVVLGVLSALLFVWTAKAQNVEHAEVATARAGVGACCLGASSLGLLWDRRRVGRPRRMIVG